MVLISNLRRFVCTAKRSSLNIVCKTVLRRCGHDGTIRGAGGKISERGAVLEEDYFYKKDKILLEKLLEDIEKCEKKNQTDASNNQNNKENNKENNNEKK